MNTIAYIALPVVALICVGTIISARMNRCPKCNRRGASAIEATKYWKKFKCRRCNHVFVQDTGH